MGWSVAGTGRSAVSDATWALGVLGRNLHVLGKLLIACESPQSLAALSKRKRPALALRRHTE